MSNQPTCHPLKSKASIPKHPLLQQRVSCGVYITMCPLACKQKTQPEQKGAPGTAGWLAQRCILPGWGLRRWEMSSRHPPPLVATRSCSSELRGVLQAQSPSASSSRRRPLATARCRSLGPAGRQEAAAGDTASTGTLCGGQERRGGGKAGAARPASPVGKSSRLPFVSKCKHCPLLSRPCQRARHRGSHTRGSCQALGVFREGAALAEPPPPGQILKTAGHAGSAPRPAGRTPSRRGRERPRHHLRAACPKDTQPGNPGFPLAARGLGGADRLRAPGALLLRRRRRAAGPRAGNFPCLDSSQADPQPSGGGRGAAFGWRETREASSSRAGRPACGARASRGEDTTVGDVLGTREGESFGEWRNRSEGRAETEGAKAKPWGHRRTCKFQGQERVSEGPEGSGRLRGLPFPPRASLRPRAHSTQHPALRQEEEVWVQPSLSAPIRSRRAGEKGRRPLGPFHRSLDFPCHAPAALDLGSGGEVVMETSPPSIATAPGGCPGGFSGPIRECPQPTCGDQCRGREEQQQEPEPEPWRCRCRRHSRCRRTLGSARQHSTRHVGHLPQTGGGGCLPSPSG